MQPLAVLEYLAISAVSLAISGAVGAIAGIFGVLGVLGQTPGRSGCQSSPVAISRLPPWAARAWRLARGMTSQLSLHRQRRASERGLIITDNAPTSPHEVALNGTGA